MSCQVYLKEAFEVMGELDQEDRILKFSGEFDSDEQGLCSFWDILDKLDCKNLDLEHAAALYTIVVKWGIDIKDNENEDDFHEPGPTLIRERDSHIRRYLVEVVERWFPNHRFVDGEYCCLPQKITNNNDEQKPVLHTECGQLYEKYVSDQYFPN